MNNSEGVRISVLVPVYGVEHYIRRCAESLFRQTMTEGVEFIFVDDASPDGSIAILRQVMAEHPEADAKIVTHEKNKGVAAARHTALDAARGEFIAFVDSDDYVDPEYLAHLYAKAMAEGADIVFSDIIEELKDGVTRIKSCQIEGYDDLGIGILVSGTINLASKLIHRSLYTEHPECTSPDDLAVSEDCFSMVCLSHFARKAACTGEAHYHYDRTNETSLTHSKQKAQMEALFRLWQYTGEFFSTEYPDGRYTELIAEMKTDVKAVLMLSDVDMESRKEYADIFREEEGRHMWKLSRGKLLMIFLVRHHLWPLVRLYTCYVDWRRRRAGEN